MNNYNFAPQGWQCPICKRVYSPSTPICYFCQQQVDTKMSNAANEQCSHEYMYQDETTAGSLFACSKCGKQKTVLPNIDIFNASAIMEALDREE